MGSLRVALDMVRHKDTQRILQKLLDESSPMPPAGELWRDQNGICRDLPAVKMG